MPDPKPILSSDSLGKMLSDLNSRIDKLATVVGSRAILLGVVTATNTQATVTTVEGKDTGLSADVAFDVSDPDNWYRVTYSVRALSDAANTTMDIRIRDGGASAPTSASTLVTGASIALVAAAGVGSSQLTASAFVQFAAGTHTLGGFYVRTAGAGNVSPGQATGQVRQLSVEIVG